MGGVVREVREHSSVALAAVNFLSFPIPRLRLCWGKIKMFAIFVSFTRFCCPLAIHYHFRIIYNNFVYLAPIVSPHSPYCPSPPPHKPPFEEAFSVKISLNGSADRHRIKNNAYKFFLFWFLMKERRSKLVNNGKQRALGASTFMLWL